MIELVVFYYTNPISQQFFEKNFLLTQESTERSQGSDIPYRQAALFVPHSGHWRRRVRSTLAARGDYCRVPKKSGANTFPKNQELFRRKPLAETPSHGERFSHERRRPGRHQQLIAMTLRQDRENKCVRIRSRSLFPFSQSLRGSFSFQPSAIRPPQFMRSASKIPQAS